MKPLSESIDDILKLKVSKRRKAHLLLMAFADEQRRRLYLQHNIQMSGRLTMDRETTTN